MRGEKAPPILVSACLAGCACRYDGGACANEKIQKLVNEGRALPLCPEQLGGLPTPRGPHEIVSGVDGKRAVLGRDGPDETESYVRGAEAVLAVCKALGIKEAILKANSPSCGCGHIYDGTFSGKIVEGDGITAALLKKNGIAVRADTD